MHHPVRLHYGGANRRRARGYPSTATVVIQPIVRVAF